MAPPREHLRPYFPAASHADLVAEEPERASAAAADWAFGDDAALRSVALADGTISITKRPAGTLTSSAEW